jgi:serine protease Do
MKKLIFTLILLTIPSFANARPVPNSFADLSEKLLPTVVNISTTQEIKNNGVIMEMPQFPPGSPFEEFFKDFFNNGANPNATKKATSLGSGFVIGEDGIIVTNNHVVEKADKITVIFSDDTALEAKLLGRDKKTDIAVLKVETNKKLPAVKFGNSDNVRVGDWVLAIGNPFGLGSTVTAGIVSARARNISSGPYDDYIQTDASINRGNSGGPLFGMGGEVIGINTAIFSPSGGSVGIGFSIPSNIAKWVVENIVKHGKIKRGWLGVKIQAVTDEIAESLNLKSAKGALVASVDENGPSAKASIEAGDVIIEFDNKPVKTMRILPRIVAETPVGKEVSLKVLRNGKIKTLKITLGELEDDEEEPKKIASLSPKGEQKLDDYNIKDLDIKVSKLTPELRQKFKISDDTSGVIITHIGAKSDAIEKGVRLGNVIAKINHASVSSPSEVIEQVKKAKSKGRNSVLLLIEDREGTHFSAIKIIK